MVVIGNAAPEDIKAVNDAKDAVKGSLRDPFSAKFGKVVYAGKGIVCGYVNARNGFGAMTGETPFYYYGGGLVEIKNSDHDRAFEMTWADFKCPEAIVR